VLLDPEESAALGEDSVRRERLIEMELITV